MSGGRESLEAERDFCLRSLRDLDSELAAGDMDGHDYVALRESYTARAASVLRALAEPGVAPSSVNEAGTAPGPAPLAEGRSRRGGWRKRTVVAVGAAMIAAGAAWALVASSATRLPGQEITGQALGPEAVARQLSAASQAEEKGDYLTAVKDYQKVLDADPNQPQALTGEGWLLAQTGQPGLVKQGLAMLAAAEQTTPSEPAAHLYRGIVLLGEGDYTSAVPELRWYLDHDPDPQLTAKVRLALNQAQAKLNQRSP